MFSECKSIEEKTTEVDKFLAQPFQEENLSALMFLAKPLDSDKFTLNHVIDMIPTKRNTDFKKLNKIANHCKPYRSASLVSFI